MGADGTSLKKKLSEEAARMGAKAFGVADLDQLRRTISERPEFDAAAYRVAVVMGVRLQDAVLSGIEDRPTPLYFHNYRQVNYQLDSIALAVADLIQDEGCVAVAMPASQVIARDPMRGHVSHRILARAAGIGFIGRNNLLVHPEFGSAVRYVSVLTDAPLPPDSPWNRLECGDCRACIPVCPAAAIGERREDFDLNACYRKLDEFTRIPFIGQHICGVCVKACRGRKGAACG